MNKYYYALSFVTNDCKGIVYEATKVLFEKGFNIADSSSTLLQGVFSMIFMVTSDKNYTEDEIKDMFKNNHYTMEVFKCDNNMHDQDGIHYSISVYGADKPGIVNAITAEIAKNDLNIIDLQTKITGKNNKVYIMMLEVVAADDSKESVWQDLLKSAAKKINTEINIRKIEVYEL